MAGLPFGSSANAKPRPGPTVRALLTTHRPQQAAPGCDCRRFITIVENCVIAMLPNRLPRWAVVCQPPT